MALKFSFELRPISWLNLSENVTPQLIDRLELTGGNWPNTTRNKPMPTKTAAIIFCHKTMPFNSSLRISGRQNEIAAASIKTKNCLKPSNALTRVALTSEIANLTSPEAKILNDLSEKNKNALLFST